MNASNQPSSRRRGKQVVMLLAALAILSIAGWRLYMFGPGKQRHVPLPARQVSTPSPQPAASVMPSKPRLPSNWRDQLGDAAEVGDIERVRQILEGEPDIGGNGESYRWHALALAASQGHAEIVRVLVEAGAEVDVRGPAEWTPLMQAAANGHDQTVSLLLSLGANPLLANEAGQYAYDLAKDRGHESVVRVFETQAGFPAIDGRPLIMAILNNDWGQLHGLIQDGVDVNAVDSEGRTALHYAAGTPLADQYSGKPNMVQTQPVPLFVHILLQAGADPNQRDRAGRTPAHYLLRAEPHPSPMRVWLSVMNRFLQCDLDQAVILEMIDEVDHPKYHNLRTSREDELLRELLEAYLDRAKSQPVSLMSNQ